MSPTTFSSQFAASFCTPGEGHEKSAVKVRRATSGNHWVPVPQAADFDAPNAQFLVGCRADEQRVRNRRTHSVDEAVTIERASLRPLGQPRWRRG